MNKKIIALLMFVLGILPMLVACGSDDDDDSAELTSEEIVKLLTGKWEVYGELREYSYETKESFIDNYKGTIEFKENKNVTFKIKESDKYSSNSLYFEEYLYIDDTDKYSILKKGGKNYIVFNSTFKSYFEIVSLKANSFRLVLDDELTYDKVKVGTVHMTMISN